MDVVFEAFDRVLDHGAGRDDEGPVGALGKQQFTGRLIERPQNRAVSVRKPLGQLDHSPLGRMLVHIHPVGLSVDPDSIVPFSAPRRCRRSLLLVVGMNSLVVGRRYRQYFILIVMQVFKEVEEELGSFEPPVAEKLGIVRRDDHRRSPQSPVKMPGLSDSIAHEVCGVRCRPFGCPLGHIRLLFVERNLPGNPMIFYSDIAPHAVIMQVRLDVIEILRVVSEIPVEFAVIRISGIPDLRAPDLLARLGIPGKDSNIVWCDHRGIDSASRPWRSIQNRVRVTDEKANAGFMQIRVIARIEGAFSQPDTTRRPVEMLDVVRSRDLYLSPLGSLVRHERQKAMRRAAGDDFEVSRILQITEPFDDIAFVLSIKDFAAFIEMTPVHQRRRVEVRRLFPRPLNFLIGQFTELLDVPDITLLKQLVAQHLAQRRRHRHRQPKLHPFISQVVECHEQRDICLADRFIEPVFFEKVGIFGMAHKRQVRVEH